MEQFKIKYPNNLIFTDYINIDLLFDNNINEQIKNNISLNDLANGKYHNVKSKSDNNIASSIKFFINNLQSFKKFKDDDNINWVYNLYNLLIIEYFDYYFKKSLRLPTFKTRLTAILRILYLLFDNKDLQIYKNISIVQDNITHFINKKEGNNKRDKLEDTKHLDFGLILKRRYDIETSFKNIDNKFSKIAYDTNQDLILLSLFSLIPPERCEMFGLTFRHSNYDNNNDDFILITNDKKCILKLNKIKKKHIPLSINIYDVSINLNDLLIESYLLYPRINVFTAKNKYPILKPVKPSNIASRLKVIFKDYNINVGVNALRSSYISYRLKDDALSYNDKTDIAEIMRTSLEQIEKSYKKLKKYDKRKSKNDEAKPIKPVKQPKTEKDIMKSYYEKSKAKIAEQQKQYRTDRNVPAYRIKLLRKLNNDKDYFSKTTKSILDKYNIKKTNDGIYF